MTETRISYTLEDLFGELQSAEFELAQVIVRRCRLFGPARKDLQITFSTVQIELFRREYSPPQIPTAFPRVS